MTMTRTTITTCVFIARERKGTNCVKLTKEIPMSRANYALSRAIESEREALGLIAIVLIDTLSPSSRSSGTPGSRSDSDEFGTRERRRPTNFDLGRAAR